MKKARFQAAQNPGLVKLRQAEPALEASRCRVFLGSWWVRSSLDLRWFHEKNLLIQWWFNGFKCWFNGDSMRFNIVNGIDSFYSDFMRSTSIPVNRQPWMNHPWLSDNSPMINSPGMNKSPGLTLMTSQSHQPSWLTSELGWVHVGSVAARVSYELNHTLSGDPPVLMAGAALGNWKWSWRHNLMGTSLLGCLALE